MSSFFQPDPVILAFIAFKQTFFLPVILLLALIRSLAARGPARRLALLSLLIAAAGIAVQVLPALLNAFDNPLTVFGSQWRNAGGGMVALLTASAPLLASAVVPGRRWWGIDALHLLLLAALAGLWAYSVWG